MNFRLDIDYYKGKDPVPGAEREFSGEVKLIVELTKQIATQLSCVADPITGSPPTCPNSPGGPPNDCTYTKISENFTGTKCAGPTSFHTDVAGWYLENAQCAPATPCALGCTAYYRLECEKSWHRCDHSYLLDDYFNIDGDVGHGVRHLQLRHEDITPSEANQYAITAYRLLSLVTDWKQAEDPSSPTYKDCFMCGLVCCLMYRAMFPKSLTHINPTGIGKSFEDCVQVASTPYTAPIIGTCQHNLANRWKDWIVVTLLGASPPNPCHPSKYNPDSSQPGYFYEDKCPFCCNQATIGPGTVK